MNGAYLLKYFISLIVICNPMLGVPVMLSLMKGKSLQEKRKVALGTALSVAIILGVMTWIGSLVLEVIGVRVSTFQVTGGLILLLLALSILRGEASSNEQEVEPTKRQSIAIVPLAFPLLAGPGAISAVIVAAELHTSVSSHLLLTLPALGIALMTAWLLFFATSIEKALGNTGLTIIAKIGGLILAAIAIENIAKGISGLFFT